VQYARLFVSDAVYRLRKLYFTATDAGQNKTRDKVKEKCTKYSKQYAHIGNNHYIARIFRNW